MTRPLSNETSLARERAERSVLVVPDGDQRAFEALRGVIEEMKPTLISEEWGVVGAIDITWTTLMIEGRRLIVDQEWDVGTTLHGDAVLVDRIVERVRLATRT